MIKNKPSIFGVKYSLGLLTSIFVLMLSVATFGQIAGYDTSTQPGGTNNFGASPLAASVTAANVTVGGLTRGGGVGTTGSGAARGFGGTGFNYTTAAAAISANAFFSFTVKANSGYNISLTSINPFSYRRSATGATSALIQYSIDGTTFNDITTLSLTSTATAGATLGPVDLSAIPALQGVSSAITVTFRIVPFGASAAGGTFYIFDVANTTAPDLAVNGTVSVVTAGGAKIIGRVTDAYGKAIKKATVTLSGGDLAAPITVLTNYAGIYNFEAPAGASYVVSVSSGRFRFENNDRVISVLDNVTDIDFVANKK